MYLFLGITRPTFPAPSEIPSLARARFLGRAPPTSNPPIQQRRRPPRERGSATNLHAFVAHVWLRIVRLISRAVVIMHHRS